MIKIQEKFDDPNIIKPMFKFKTDRCELTRQSLNYLDKPKFINLSIYKKGYLLIQKADGRQKDANRVDYSNGTGIWRGESKKQLENILKQNKSHMAVGQLSQIHIGSTYKKCLIFKTK